jgi:hypothetical protein
VHGTLLVHYLDEGQLGDWVVESVEQTPVAVTRQAGDIRNAVSFESLSDDLSDCKVHGSLLARTFPCRTFYSYKRQAKNQSANDSMPCPWRGCIIRLA